MDNLDTTTDVKRFPEIDYSLPPMDKIFIDSVSYYREEMKNSNNAKKANTKMRFYIPAQKRAVDPSELYFQLNVAARTSADAALAAPVQEALRLANGGVHSLFRELIIRDGKGNIIEKILNYNLVAKILQDTLLTKEVKNNLLNVEGLYKNNSLYKMSYESKFALQKTVSGVGNAAHFKIQFTAANNVITGTNTTFTKDLQPGSILTVNNVSYTIESVTNDLAAVAVNVAGDVAARDIAATDYVSGLHLVRTDYHLNHHTPLMSSAGAVYCFQPYVSGFLSQNKYLHLDQLGGLEFEFTLDSNNMIFDNTNTTGAANVFIKKGYVHYSALEFSPIVEASLAKAYMRGLAMSFPVYHVVSRTSNASTSINEEYQESLAILKMVKIVSRPATFETATEKSFAFEDLTAANQIYWEINKQRFTEYGNDEILPEVVYMNNRLGKNLMGDYKHSTMSYGEFKRAGMGSLIFNVQNYKDGNFTGVNTNRSTMRLKVAGGVANSPQPGLTQQARQVDCLFLHEQYVLLKDGEPLVVKS